MEASQHTTALQAHGAIPLVLTQRDTAAEGISNVPKAQELWKHGCSALKPVGNVPSLRNRPPSLCAVEDPNEGAEPKRAQAPSAPRQHHRRGTCPCPLSPVPNPWPLSPRVSQPPTQPGPHPKSTASRSCHCSSAPECSQELTEQIDAH